MRFHFRILLTAFLTFGSLSKIQAQIAQNEKNSAEVEQAVYFSLQKDQIHQFAESYDFTKGDAKEFRATLLNKINAVFVESKAVGNMSIRRLGIRTGIELIHELGMNSADDKDVFQVIPSALQSGFGSCQNYDDCENLALHLSALASALPQESVAIADQRHQEIQGAAWCISEQLACRTVLYGLASIKYYATVLLLSNFSNPKFRSRIPKITKAGLSIIQTAETETTILGAQLAAATQDQLITAIGNGISEVTSDSDTIVKDTIQRIQAIGEQTKMNSAIRLYIGRMNQRDISAWLKAISSESDPHHREIAWTMLTLFSGREFLLPSREDWLKAAKSLAPNYDVFQDANGQKIPAGAFIAAAQALVANEKKRLIETLKADGFSDLANSQNGVTLSRVLVDNENELSRTFAGFSSLSELTNNLNASLGHLGVSALSAKDLAGKKADNEHLDQARDQFAIDRDQALSDWLQLACYSFFSLDAGSEKISSMPVNIPFLEGAPIDLARTCRPGKGISNSDMADIYFPGNKINRFILAGRLKEVWRPFKIEVTLDVISLPIMIASAVGSGGVAGVASNAARQVAIRFLIQRLSNEVAQRALVWLVTRAVSTVVAATVYTVISKSLTVGTTAALKAAGIIDSSVPVWDSQKTFMENYGREILYGSAIFFFLPYTELVGARASKLLATRGLLGKSAFSQSLGKLGFGLVEGTAVFTSIPYIERFIEAKKDQPTWKGFGDLSKTVANSLAATLAFKISSGELRLSR